MALAIMGILGSVNAAILNAGFEAWNHSYTRLALQEIANELMEILLEGGVDDDGLRDAVELRDAGLSAISFVTLWADTKHIPDPLHNKAQVFTLEKQFKAGAATPIGQVRASGSTDWNSVPIGFTYGEGSDPNRLDDLLTFTDPIPSGAAIKILYTPDADAHPETQMRFWWNATDGLIYRSYAGVTKPALRRMQGSKVERLAFLYYDNLNRLLPLGQAYTQAELRRITGVKLYLLLTKGDQWKELTSFTNIRNVQTIGATIAKGSVLPLPTPQEIKAFSLGDFSSLKETGVVELVIKTDNTPRMLLRLEFSPGASAGLVVLDRFQIEAPPGTIRTSAILNQPIAQNEFVNLLAIDRTGLYDYDDDPDIKDALIIKGANPIVEVTRCDFTVASLFIRP